MISTVFTFSFFVVSSFAISSSSFAASFCLPAISFFRLSSCVFFSFVFFCPQANTSERTDRVKIIFDPFKANNFTNGDILVTGMTRPEFLPLMHKAGAFVTDAGGILSHAAITARELKKPCVIGTQIATKILKDGDLVEVDANKGIVKKI